MRTKPQQTTGLGNSDNEVQRIADELWRTCGRGFGNGRLVCAGTGRELLASDHVPQDFEFEQAPAGTIDYIHRTDHGTEIYFVSNQSSTPVQVPAMFRTSGKTPELWDAVSGEIHKARYQASADGRARITLDLASYGSIYVVFRAVSTAVAAPLPVTESTSVTGPWHVKFESPAAIPGERDFATLQDWTTSGDPMLKYFSGHGTYTTTLAVLAGKRVVLDLGRVGEIAEVWVNGRLLGTYWAPPFRVDITKAAKPGPNQLEVRVTNFWINRLLGDALLPAGQRTTRTNIKALPKDPPRPSGLMGPVMLLSTP